MSENQSFWARSTPDILETEVTDWIAHTYYRGATSSLQELGVHFFILEQGKIPHPPHIHPEEEILVLISGQLDLITEKGNRQLNSGDIVYCSSDILHTIKNTGQTPAILYVLKWKGQKKQLDTSDNKVFFCNDPDKSLSEPIESNKVLVETAIDIETPYLDRLRCKYIQMGPGAKFPPHSHPHALVVLLLKGELGGLFHYNHAPAAIYVAENIPHTQFNKGEETSLSLAIEFHFRPS